MRTVISGFLASDIAIKKESITMSEKKALDSVKDGMKGGVKKGLGVIGEFKEFISRGNVLDMAVGVVMGTAFTAIVNSLVKDVIMPAVGIITGGIDFSDMQVTLAEAVMEGEEVVKEAVNLRYGAFIQSIISFLLIAVAVFMLVKVVNMFHRKKKEEPKPEEPPKPDPQIVLLEEIRDQLKKQNGEPIEEKKE